MSAEGFERLREVLGAEGFEATSGIDIDGCATGAMLVPGSVEALCGALALTSEAGHRLYIRGAGTRLGLGNLPSGEGMLLSTRRLAGVRRFEPDDGVVEASGGTPLRDVRAAVLERGWELPIDAGGDAATLGGAIATAAYGPRCLGFGPVRRNVLGLEVVSAAGTLSRCGGRVVKNVTGYDLAKLYTGSFGTLGVITGAWLRLQPRPRAVELRSAEFSETDSALARGLEASRRGSARACVLLSPDLAREAGLEHSLAASWVLAVEFAGEVSECARDAAWVEKELGGSRPAAASGIEALSTFDGLRDRLPSPSNADFARLRIATLPSKLACCVRPLMKTGARISVDPGLGLVHAETRDLAHIEDLLATARECAARCEGSLIIEALPAAAKRDLDVFGEPGPQLAIMRRLKEEFDPDARLNPGRFVGGL